MSRPNSAAEELEQLIDTYGLLHVMTGLSLVCSEKAEHLCTNWQDTAAAKPWLKASAAIEAVAHKISPLNI